MLMEHGNEQLTSKCDERMHTPAGIAIDSMAWQLTFVRAADRRDIIEWVRHVMLRKSNQHSVLILSTSVWLPVAVRMHHDRVTRQRWFMSPSPCMSVYGMSLSHMASMKQSLVRWVEQHNPSIAHVVCPARSSAPVAPRQPG